MLEAASVKIVVPDAAPIVAALRAELAQLTRDHAAREAGPVGERLRQIADAFEGA